MLVGVTALIVFGPKGLAEVSLLRPSGSGPPSLLIYHGACCEIPIGKMCLPVMGSGWKFVLVLGESVGSPNTCGWQQRVRLHTAGHSTGHRAAALRSLGATCHGTHALLHTARRLITKCTKLDSLASCAVDPGLLQSLRLAHSSSVSVRSVWQGHGHPSPLAVQHTCASKTHPDSGI